MRNLRENGVPGSFGYPVQVRRVATANGRLDGLIGNYGTPGGVAFQMDLFLRSVNPRQRRRTYFLGFNTTSSFSSADVNFTPGPFNRDRVFKGQFPLIGVIGSGYQISPRRRVFVYSVAQGSYDLAPGGWFNAQEEIVTSTEGVGQNRGDNRKPYDAVFRNVRPYHNFIPTVSALGFQYQSMANYQTTFSLPNPYTRLLGRDLICLNETPFDAYYGPASENTEHVQPDPQGIEFLFRELSGQAEKPAFASATSTICPNGNAEFTLPASCGRFPITYTWTLSGNLQFANGQTTASGTTQIIYGTSAGSGQVTVVASQQGLAPSAPLVQTIRVGDPPVAATYYCGGCSPSGTRTAESFNYVETGSITVYATPQPGKTYTFAIRGGNFTLTNSGPNSAYFQIRAWQQQYYATGYRDGNGYGRRL